VGIEWDAEMNDPAVAVCGEFALTYFHAPFSDKTQGKSHKILRKSI
jgi:hypothetical protein